MWEKFKDKMAIGAKQLTMATDKHRLKERMRGERREAICKL